MTESESFTTTYEIVPLPDVLGTCQCPGRPRLHRTTCQIAIDFDATPLSERPEYELGRRFAAIGWDYPVTISGSFRIEIALDPMAIILARSDEYEEFEMEQGYQDWEKPMTFLCYLIKEQYYTGGVCFGSRRMSADRSFMDELWDRGWTKEDTERLNEALGQPKPDPNQGVLV